MASKFANPDCPICDGQGSIYVISKIGDNDSDNDGDLNYRDGSRVDYVESHIECQCVKTRKILDKLNRVHPDLFCCGPKISHTKLQDMLDRNVLLVGSYKQTLRAIRHVLTKVYIEKGLGFNCRFISDKKILDIRFARSQDNEGVPVRFTDEMAKPDLLVIFTGHIMGTHSQAPISFYEALRSRNNLKKGPKPTWVHMEHALNEYDSIFNFEVCNFLDDVFTTIVMNGVSKGKKGKKKEVLGENSKGIVSQFDIADEEMGL